ncbi:hypothetical protein D6833_13850, partial [Candidatus Parcubacteria bacterium]
PGLNANANYHLGAEYKNIARALNAGKGFANPFGIDTGPTAWMPPVYPALLALLIAVVGPYRGLIAAVVLLKNLLLVGTGLLIYYLAGLSSRRLRPSVAVSLYGAWLLVFFHWFFQWTHDVWLIMLLVETTLVGGLLLHKWPKRVQTLAWGGLGGTVFLTSPAAGLAWLALSWDLARSRKLWQRIGPAVAIALAFVAAWSIRNAVVLGKPMLIKSNLFFDLYQGSFACASGVYDAPFLSHHPVWTSAQNPDSEYRRLGEARFVELYKQRFLAALRERPDVMLKQVGKRLLAATVWYHRYDPMLEGRRPPIRSVAYALPFASLSFLILFDRRRTFACPVRRSAVLVYSTFLVPYVLVAFYIRYLLPLTPILVLFAFWAAD